MTRKEVRPRGFEMKWKEVYYSTYQGESYALGGQVLQAMWCYIHHSEHLKCDTDQDENDKRMNKKKSMSGSLHYPSHNSFP
jgi:fatty-acid desaturase